MATPETKFHTNILKRPHLMNARWGPRAAITLNQVPRFSSRPFSSILALRSLSFGSYFAGDAISLKRSSFCNGANVWNRSPTRSQNRRFSFDFCTGPFSCSFSLAFSFYFRVGEKRFRPCKVAPLGSKSLSFRFYFGASFLITLATEVEKFRLFELCAFPPVKAGIMSEWKTIFIYV